MMAALLLVVVVVVALLPLSSYGLAFSKKVASGTGFGAKPIEAKQHTPDTSPETKSLVDFLTAHQADLAGTEIGIRSNDSNDERTSLKGLYATWNIKKDATICKIPSACALALSHPADVEDAPTVAHGGVNLIKMYLQNEEQRANWAPYLDTLPTRDAIDPTPDFFDDAELELLEFPRVINRAKERKQQIAELAAENNLNVADLQYATWIVSSRAFPIQLADEDSIVDDDKNTQEIVVDDRGQVISKAEERKYIRVLVPYIDVANHHSEPNAKLMLIDPEKDDAWFALQATRPIKAGKEICIAYGSGVDSTVELLLNYGFVPGRNKIDGFMLEKGGKDCIDSIEGWTTTLEEDKRMLAMITDPKEDATLHKILSFRIKLKESYPEEKLD